MSIFVELPPDLYSPTAFDDFTPSAGFGLGNARACMWASQLAYETHQPATLATVAARWRFVRITPFNATVAGFKTSFDTRGIVAERPEATIVAFGGTDPVVWENLVTDFSVVPAPQTDVHGGFTNALNAVWDTVRTAITALPRPVFFTGHSLGAALAALASRKAADAGIAPVAIYTFGMPRVGGRSFAASYNATLGAITYRLVHGNDVVATVPMSKLGFRHVGRLLQCASGAKFEPSGLSTVGSDEPHFSAGLKLGIMSGIAKLLARDFFSPPGPGPIGPLLKYLPPQIRDHLPDRYIEALKP